MTETNEPRSDFPFRNSLYEVYFDWLCSIVKIGDASRLAVELHLIEYYWSIPNDDNRGLDAEDLRLHFVDEFGYSDLDLEVLEQRTVSMFEVLVALARRMDFIMYEEELGSRVDHWFWELIDNMGLLSFDNSGYYEVLWSSTDVQNIVYYILDRKYGRDGRGGLFPLKNSKKDQRKVELWYQMNLYLAEKYNVG